MVNSDKFHSFSHLTFALTHLHLATTFGENTIELEAEPFSLELLSTVNSELSKLYTLMWTQSCYNHFFKNGSNDLL